MTCKKIFSILSLRNIKIYLRETSKDPFQTRYGSLITSAMMYLSHMMYRITWVYIAVAANMIYTRGLNFSRSPSRCADITSIFFPFWFSMAVHTSGGCARRWRLLFRGLEHARPRTKSCSNDARDVRQVRETLKSRFAESLVEQPDVAFPREKLYLRIKTFFFLWISGRWALLLSQAVSCRQTFFRRIF